VPSVARTLDAGVQAASNQTRITDGKKPFSVAKRELAQIAV